MTLELELRRRAKRARWLSAIWGLLAAALLVSVCLSMPVFLTKILTVTVMTSKALKEAGGEAFNVQTLALATLIAVLLLACFASYACVRSAAFEMEIAIRSSGLADALCAAGNDLAQLERTAAIFVPKTRHLLATELLPVRELKPLADLVKQLKP